LLVDATLYATAEDKVATCETSEEGVVGLLFARERRSAEKYHSRLIGHGKLSKVAGVGAGGFEDEAELITEGARAKEKYHDKGMGEADFSPVDGTIAGCFGKSEVVGVLRIKDDPIHCLLHGIHLCVNLGNSAFSAAY